MNLLMERLKALRIDSTVTEMINQVNDSATKNGMKMPKDDESRVFRTRACYRYTTEPEALSPVTYKMRWKTAFFEAVDLFFF